MRGAVLLDGVTITVVGMLAVFTFLVILVLSMTLLEKLVAVLPGASRTPREAPGSSGRAILTGQPGTDEAASADSGSRDSDQALVAAAVAAIRHHRQRN